MLPFFIVSILKVSSFINITKALAFCPLWHEMMINSRRTAMRTSQLFVKDIDFDLNRKFVHEKRLLREASSSQKFLRGRDRERAFRWKKLTLTYLQYINKNYKYYYSCCDWLSEQTKKSAEIIVCACNSKAFVEWLIEMKCLDSDNEYLLRFASQWRKVKVLFR